MVKKAEEKEAKESKLSDTIKKIVSVGVGAAFMTEDAVKGVLADLPLSKDILSGLVQNAKSTKEEFVKSIRDEINSYLKNVDPKVLVDHIVENYDIEVKSSFVLKKKSVEKDDTKKKESAK